MASEQRPSWAVVAVEAGKVWTIASRAWALPIAHRDWRLIEDLPELKVYENVDYKTFEIWVLNPERTGATV